MAKRLEELLDARISESQNRILEDAKIILKDYLADDVHLKQLVEKAKGQKNDKDHFRRPTSSSSQKPRLTFHLFIQMLSQNASQF